MTRRALVLAVCALAAAACRRSATPATPGPDAPTELEIVVLDDYGTRDSCEGVAPRALEVAVDDRPLGTIAVPCRTELAMPPLQLAGPRVTLAAGTHVVRVREVGGTAEPEKQVIRQITVPALDDDEPATKLPVWASDDELDVTAPKVRITFDAE